MSHVHVVDMKPNVVSIQDSLDNISEQQNEEYSKGFFKFFEEKLGTTGSRGYVTFIDPGRANMG